MRVLDLGTVSRCLINISSRSILDPSLITGDKMDERFLNVTDDNTTSSTLNISSLSPEEPPVSANQLYICNLYKFVITGVIQLGVSIIGLAGKYIETLRGLQADYYHSKNTLRYKFDLEQILACICVVFSTWLV